MLKNESESSLHKTSKGIIFTDKIYTINEIQKMSIPIFKKYNIKKIYLFGSYAREEANENSDIDFLISNNNLTLLSLSALENELIEVFKKDIDIITIETYTKQIDYNNIADLYAKSIFYNNILKDRRIIYE